LLTSFLFRITLSRSTTRVKWITQEYHRCIGEVIDVCEKYVDLNEECAAVAQLQAWTEWALMERCVKNAADFVIELSPDGATPEAIFEMLMPGAHIFVGVPYFHDTAEKLIQRALVMYIELQAHRASKRELRELGDGQVT